VELGSGRGRGAGEASQLGGVGKNTSDLRYFRGNLAAVGGRRSLHPLDHTHQRGNKMFEALKELRVPDTAVFEVHAVLRARGHSPWKVTMALLAVNEAVIRQEVADRTR